MLDLVAEPRRMPRRIHMADPADGNSLQEQMGMERCGDSFQAMLVAIRESCAARGINSNVAYRKQSPAKLKAVKDDVFKKLSFLIQFEGAWPVTSYLKMQLKCHLSRAVRVDAPLLFTAFARCGSFG
ncbi:hypothetical protein C8Q76DRAFT_797529 [Earliella scabrosa]|nr:hypothetical protein C8Q76DRAFT_797529 [Earliella scabrosa]